MNNSITLAMQGRVRQGSLLNPAPEIPEGAITTSDGKYVKTTAGDYIVSVNSLIPEGALISLGGSFIKTLNNTYITI